MDKLGLSKKTNIAIAAITGINLAKDSMFAVTAIVIIAVLAGTYQFVIDRDTK